MGRVGICVFAIVATLLGASSVVHATEPVQFLTGPKVREALQKPLSASWDNMDLRTIVERIESAKRVAVLVDRRIDPSRIRFAHAADEPLHTFLERLAAESNAGTTLLGNVVYLGPAESSAKLRTLAALRSQELKEQRISSGRLIELGRGRTLRWDDLETPAGILERLAKEHDLPIAGLEQVPHDLWAGATFPDVSLGEALSLVLVQFDLTFAWEDQGRGVRLEPIPEVVAIQQAHPVPRGMSPASALERWKEAIPNLDARVEKGQIIVTGPLEIQELVDRVRRGERIGRPAAASEGPKPARLETQRYSLKIQQSPASALLKTLQQPEHGKLKFKYDAAELKAAGIDLDKRITFDVKQVKIGELLKNTFDPLGIEFEIDMEERIVTLRPAGR